MPVTVVVRSASGGVAPSLTFDGGRVVIGRSDGCDVRLPDPSISLRHASIRAQGAAFVLVDEGSTNGTWVGGVKLGANTPRLVRTGDLVRVGRVWLEIIVGHRPITPELGLATRDLALALVRHAMDAVGDDTQALVRISEGPDLGAELPLVEDGRAYVIGRADTCDLPLADEDASREHATVTRRAGQVMLRDLASRNGVFLGEVRLTAERDVAWRPPTMVRIGASVLSLYEPVALALSELEAAADERLDDDDAPPAPAPEAPLGAPAPAPAPTGAEAPPGPPLPGAPIAEIGQARARAVTTVPRARPRRTWTAPDIALVAIAVAVIGASLVGLVWVLR